MSWFILIAAGILEIAWAVGLKYTNGFRNPMPSFFVLGAVAASIFLLALAARQIPIGIAYPVWVGIGALGTVLAGALLFREPLSAPKILLLFLLFASVVGLKLAR